ncbi:hypothetical protein BST61_g2512 [Cercospora zeina]
MAPSSKRKRVNQAQSGDRPEKRVKLKMIALRSLVQKAFDTEALELLDQLFSGAKLPATVNEEAAQVWLIRLEDLLPQLREDETRVEYFLVKVIEDRTGDSTDELVPEELRETRDRCLRDRGVRELAATLADTPELKKWLANCAKKLADDSEADGPDCDSDSPDFTSESKLQEGTGPGQMTNKQIDKPRRNYWFEFVHGTQPSPAYND